MGYRLLMLGPPVLLRGSDTVVIKSRKGQALLWYLATHPTVSFDREHLYGLLWDEAPTDTGRRAFTTMLSRLRRELPADCFRGPRGQLGWDPNIGITTDVADFLRWTDHVESHRGRTPTGFLETDEQKRDVYRALSLWRGPLLDGFSCESATYEEWMITERQRLEIRILTALTALLNAEKAGGRWEQVTALAQRALQIDPLQESFHRAIMEALFRQGNRSGAVAQFEQCRRTLREELGSEPTAATMELIETIKSTQSPTASVSATPAHTPTPDGALGGSLPRRIVPDHIRSITRAMPPLVGRHREYNQVIDALRRPSWDASPIVLLHGEAGIGKTRLLSEILDATAASKLTGSDFFSLLVGRAYESMIDVPYATFVDALDPVMQDVDLPKLHIPDIWLRELGRLLPDVFVHLPDLKPPEPMESSDDRLRLFQAVARFLAALPQPVLLALDDLQWADALSLSLLTYLLRHPVGRLNLAAIVTVRDGDDSDELRHLLSTLEREKRLTRVALNYLTKDDTFTLVETLFPMQDGSARADRIYSHTLGHPLYTVELASMLIDHDRGRSDRHDRGDVGNETAPLPVPPTVQDVFIGRLLRLGGIATDVADALSLFRQGATLDQLRQVTQLSEADVAVGVQALTHAHITSENRDETLSFRHDVFRRVVFEKLPLARRIYLHRQVYTCISEGHSLDLADESTTLSDPIDQQLLTHLIDHAIGGRLWEEAYRWSRQAARIAEHLYAFPTAVEHLNTSLLCLDHLPASDVHRHDRLDIELHVAKLDSWSPPDKRDARLAAAAQLAQQYSATAHLPLIHMAQADSLIRQGRCKEAAGLLEKLAPLAERDPRIAIGLNAWWGAIKALTGDVKPALAYFSKVQEVMGEQVLKPGTSVHAGMAACYATAEDFEQANIALASMEQEEKQQGYQTLTGKLLTVTATVAFLQGEWETAADYARKGLQTSRTAEDWANEALSALWLGAATLELDSKSKTPPSQGARAQHEPTRGHEAVTLLEEALAASKRAQTYTRRDFIYAFLALAYSRTGQHEKAANTLETGLHLVERFGYMEGRALCTEVQGRIAGTRGELQTALSHLNNALAQFEKLGNVAGATRCRGHLKHLMRP